LSARQKRYKQRKELEKEKAREKKKKQHEKKKCHTYVTEVGPCYVSFHYLIYLLLMIVFFKATKGVREFWT